MSARRLPAVAFTLLALATVGAFFLVQALKTADPLIWPTFAIVPRAFDPVHGRVCHNSQGPLDYRHTQITLEVPRADTVGVYIVSAENQSQTVATVSNGTPMRASVLAKDSKAWYPATFTWNGLLATGAPAQQGLYYFRVVLEHEGRSIDLSDDPIHVLTQPPHPRILSVRLQVPGGTLTTTTTRTTGATTTGATTAGSTTTGTATTGTATTGTATGGTATAGTRTSGSSGTAVATTGPPVLSPPDGNVRITFTPGSYRRAWIDIYRTDVAGRPQLAGPPLAVHKLSRDWILWNGEVDGTPLPAGTYLVGITAQDQACNRGSWPSVLPPARGTTPGAGVTIRYLTVTPPLTPTVSGSRASVAVDSPGAGFIWKLRRSGTTKVLAHGHGRPGSSELHVRMPRHRPGLYTLVVRSATQSAAVPLVASQAGAVAAHAPVLVILPMLTWIGNSPVDDSGSGLPDTLSHGDAVVLNRPLVDGPPGSVGADAALLSYLDSLHLSYQLTTDVALAEGTGPSLTGRSGVVFPDGSHFLPGSLAAGAAGLPAFVRAGGRVLTLGTGTFQGISRLRLNRPGSGAATIHTSVPIFSAADPFGAQRGPITPTGGQLITDLIDHLGLLGTGLSFSGFTEYQPITPPGTTTAVSEAGISDQSAAIVGFSHGSGIVIEVGLPNFGTTLAHDFDSQQLLYNAWHLLSNHT